MLQSLVFSTLLASSTAFAQAEAPTMQRYTFVYNFEAPVSEVAVNIRDELQDIRHSVALALVYDLNKTLSTMVGEELKASDLANSELMLAATDPVDEPGIQ